MKTVITLVTCPDYDKAESIARELVETRLAACVNIVSGIRSVYRWEGKVQSEGECLLIIKSVDTLLKKLEKKIQEIHPYDTPEFVVVDTEYVSKEYAKWVIECVDTT